MEFMKPEAGNLRTQKQIQKEFSTFAANAMSILPPLFTAALMV
jgi:hypothetical protein